MKRFGASNPWVADVNYIDRDIGAVYFINGSGSVEKETTRREVEKIYPKIKLYLLQNTGQKGN